MTSQKDCFGKPPSMQEQFCSIVGAILQHCWRKSPALLEKVSGIVGENLQHCWRKSPALLEKISQAREDIWET